MASVQSLILYYTGSSPNPWKVAMILEELELPYELVKVDNVKSDAYLAINPNGRVPAVEDPNTGVTSWESGSIIDYLIETYDRNHKLSYSTSPEKFQTRNWAHFQMSGQGPYFGQKAWFSRFHPEKVESAIDRYSKEIHRVLGVLESHLAGSQYLVGDKVTYADLMWVPWNQLLMPFLLGQDFDLAREFPRTFAWHQKLISRAAVLRMESVKATALEGK